MRQAVLRFPSEPKAYLHLGLNAPTAQERKEALMGLLTTSPQHQLGRYLLALAQWETGDTDSTETTLASITDGLPLEDEGQAQVAMLTAAYTAAGQPESAAMANAIAAAEPVFLQTLDVLDDSLSAVAEAHLAANDLEATEAVRAMRASLAMKLQQTGKSLLSELTGVQMELASGASIPTEKLESLREREASLKRLMRNTDPTESTLPSSVLADYLQRWKAHGEVSAREWLELAHPRQLD